MSLAQGNHRIIAGLKQGQMIMTPFRMDLPTDAPVPAMLTRALNVFVDKFGEQMVCAAEERKMDGCLTVETSYEVTEGPCAGRRFTISFSLEPEGELITH